MFFLSLVGKLVLRDSSHHFLDCFPSDIILQCKKNNQPIKQKKVHFGIATIFYYSCPSFWKGVRRLFFIYSSYVVCVVPNFEVSSQRLNFAVCSSSRNPDRFYRLQCCCSMLLCATDTATNVWRFLDLDPCLSNGRHRKRLVIFQHQ